MLQTLHIENVALIDKAELNFNSKLNVISGETGAWCSCTATVSTTWPHAAWAPACGAS